MAEGAIRDHQALTTAHVAGRTPTVTAQEPRAVPTIFYTPQLGEQVVESGMLFGATEASLRELQLYWKRIPDFGVKDTKVFPSETGWAQVLYWGGTADDGRVIEAQEVDVITTDEAFHVTRFEIYSDAKQWRDILKFLHDGQLPEVGYGELVARQAGSS
jgi:hypothetical protein